MLKGKVTSFNPKGGALRKAQSFPTSANAIEGAKDASRITKMGILIGDRKKNDERGKKVRVRYGRLKVSKMEKCLLNLTVCDPPV